MFNVKQADRPDFVTAATLANHRYDSHSSRRRITPALKLPTRTLREQPQRVPIWNCSRWRLPRFTVTEYARLCGPIPRLMPGLRRVFGGRPLTVTPLYGVRTFLPPAPRGAPASDCLACITGALYRAAARLRKKPWHAPGDCEIRCRHFKSLLKTAPLKWRKLHACPLFFTPLP